MKRLILLIAVSFLLLEASAQIKPNSYFISSGFGGKKSKENDGSEHKSFKFTPSLNYAISRQWSVGVFMEYKKSIDKSNHKITGINMIGYTMHIADFTSTSEQFFIGSQVRYYYPIVLGSLYFYGELQGGINTESLVANDLVTGLVKQQDLNGTIQYVPMSKEVKTDKEVKSIQSYLSPGLVYFLTPKISVELETNILRYNKSTKDNSFRHGDDLAQSITADLSLANTQIGASFYF